MKCKIQPRWLSQCLRAFPEFILLQIWDVAQKRIRAMFKQHGGTVFSVTFSPDGRSLISGSQDKSVRLWNIRDGSSKKLPATNDASYFVSVVFSPDGRYIAAGDPRHRLWMWDSRTHKLVANWKGHTDCVWCVKFTPDGKGLMSGARTIWLDIGI